jgi:exopolysaccharide biosynthesis polyprenyl glycosylphosphotransferase
MSPLLRRKILVPGLQLFDLAVTTLSLAFAAWAEYAYVSDAASFAGFLELRISMPNVLLILGFLLICHLTLSYFGLYRSRRLSNQWDEVADVFKAMSVTTAWLGLGAVIGIRIISPVFLISFWAASIVMVGLGRQVLRVVLHRLRRLGRNLRNVLIIGTNPRALVFARKIASNPELGYRIIGFADVPRDSAEPWPRLVATLDNLPNFLREHVVDEVEICIPLRSFYDGAARIVSQCAEQGIIVRFLTDVFSPHVGRLELERFEDEPVISFYTGPMEGWQTAVKRMLDICLSLMLILLASPLMALTAGLIRLGSPGPVLFAQERVGANKRRFRLYKFRTMVVDAEQRIQELEQYNEVSGPVFKIKHDPRITPTGRFLRRTSLDELPQLFNVLMGDMSLVGPRPLPVRDYNGFSQDWHRRRFSVRPGITCLWQVQGRNSIPFEKWMELDMEYIDRWSLWLDFKILAKTVPTVLKGTGA